MKYKSSPQSGQRNVKLHKRNRQQKNCQSTGWRKSIAEFKTKQRSWKKIKETKTEEIHEQEQHYCSEHRQFVDPNISHAMFSNLDESVHRMWNIFNWGQSMETMLANWLSTRHVQQGMPMGFGHFERYSNRSASFHNHDFYHLDRTYQQVPRKERSFKIELVDLEDLLGKIDLD